MADIALDLTINDERIVRDPIDGEMWLNDFLRNELDLTGTKFCCGIAVCRVCTVAVARVSGAHPEPIQSCTTPLSAVNGKIITTVEGLGKSGELHPLQLAFLRNFSFQCGYSAPGFLMAAYCLLDRLQRSPVPKSAVDAAIEDAVGQHICRCSGYVRYHRAIREVILDTPGLAT
jgi:aerobic-type carbon monoxide dehydrogenase small subunit (CoxS/CutS family)